MVLHFIGIVAEEKLSSALNDQYHEALAFIDLVDRNRNTLIDFPWVTSIFFGFILVSITSGAVEMWRKFRDR
jgi:hypothetical protein